MASVHRHDPRRVQLSIVPAEVSDPLTDMQLRTHLDDASWVGQQLLDHPAQLVQLGAVSDGVNPLLNAGEDAVLDGPGMA